jgi:hypothetical protein
MPWASEEFKLADEYVTRAIYEHLGMDRDPPLSSAELAAYMEDRTVEPAPAGKPLLIAFTGFLGCGKTTAAEYLRTEGFVRRKFADPLKNMLRAIGATEAELEGSEKETPSARFGGKSPRHAMQTLGTEWGRDCIGEFFWKNLWEQQVAGDMGAGKSVVNDDCRFINEVESVRAHGGVIVRIFRQPSDTMSAHASELGINGLPFDYSIFNTGTIAQLHAKLEQLGKHLRSPNDAGSSDAARHGL